MIVVSEIGDIWSPHTDPAREAAMQTTKSGSLSGNMAVTIGIKIPNVPQEVPVAKASPVPTRNKTAGKIAVAVIFPERTLFTKAPAASLLLQKPPSVQASTRIRIAETIILKPCGIHSANSLKEMTLLGR